MDDVIIIQPSGRYVILRMLATIFVVDSIYGILFLALAFTSTNQTLDRTFIILLWIAHALKFVILVFLLSDIVVRYLNVRYYITKHHLIVGKGIIGEEEKIYELNQVRKISSRQDWFGRRFGYGQVKLLLGARGFEEDIYINNIVNPRHVVKEIERYLGEVVTPT